MTRTFEEFEQQVLKLAARPGLMFTAADLLDYRMQAALNYCMDRAMEEPGPLGTAEIATGLSRAIMGVMINTHANMTAQDSRANAEKAMLHIARVAADTASALIAGTLTAGPIYGQSERRTVGTA